MTEENPVQTDFRRAFRIAWYGIAAAAVVACAVLVPMKWRGLLPRETWSRVLLLPAFYVSSLPIILFPATQPQKKMLQWL